MKKITISVDEKLVEQFEEYLKNGIPRLEVTDADHYDDEEWYRMEDMGGGIYTKSEGVGGVILAMAQAYMNLCDECFDLDTYETNEDDEDDHEDDHEDDEEAEDE